MKKVVNRMAVIATVFCLALPTGAFAADWQFYGTASVNTFWEDKDVADTTNYTQTLNPGANIGAEIQVSDNLAGKFEYGTEGGNANLVVLYGEWNFGAGSLLVGQEEVPAALGISGQVWDDDRGLDGLGEFNPGERAQLRLTLDRFEIAAVEPNTQVATGTSTLSNTNSEVKIPAIHARYTFATNDFDASIAGAAGRFDYSDESVTSYVALASMGVTFKNVRLAAQGWFGQNVGNIAEQDTRGADVKDGYAIYEGSRIHDVDAWGAALVAQLIVNENLSFEAGYGFVELDYGSAVMYGHDEDKVQSYYINMPITLAEGVQIVPEIGVVDYDETGQEEITYGGAKWQVEF